MDLSERVRRLCLALPEAFELDAWGHPTFRVGPGKGKMFLIAGENGTSIRLKADPEEREALLEHGEPFYEPPYVAGWGWIGMTLEPGSDWERVAELIATAYCLVAPKKLAEQVTVPPSPGLGS